MNHFLNRLYVALELNQVKLSSKNQRLIQEYFAICQKWGAIINITNNLNEEDFIRENVLDPCLGLVQYLINMREKVSDNREIKIVDIGCGGGFVGIIWRIMLGNCCELLLIDSDRKKINFCREVIRKLELSNCRAVHHRVEEYKRGLSAFDIVVTRATWCMELCTEYGFRLLRTGGRLVVFGSWEQGQLDNSGAVELVDYVIMPYDIHRVLRVCSNR